MKKFGITTNKNIIIGIQAFSELVSTKYRYTKAARIHAFSQISQKIGKLSLFFMFKKKT